MENINKKNSNNVTSSPTQNRVIVTRGKDGRKIITSSTNQLISQNDNSDNLINVKIENGKSEENKVNSDNNSVIIPILDNNENANSDSQEIILSDSQNSPDTVLNKLKIERDRLQKMLDKKKQDINEARYEKRKYLNIYKFGFKLVGLAAGAASAIATFYADYNEEDKNKKGELIAIIVGVGVGFVSTKISEFIGTFQTKGLEEAMNNLPNSDQINKLLNDVKNDVKKMHETRDLESNNNSYYLQKNLRKYVSAENQPLILDNFTEEPRALTTEEQIEKNMEKLYLEVSQLKEIDKIYKKNGLSL